MTLLDIIAGLVDEWPDGVLFLSQNRDGSVVAEVASGIPGPVGCGREWPAFTGVTVGPLPLCDDWHRSIVTEASWQARRRSVRRGGALLWAMAPKGATHWSPETNTHRAMWIMAGGPTIMCRTVGDESPGWTALMDGEESLRSAVGCPVAPGWAPYDLPPVGDMATDLDRRVTVMCKGHRVVDGIAVAITTDADGGERLLPSSRIEPLSPTPPLCPNTPEWSKACETPPEDYASSPAWVKKSGYKRLDPNNLA